MPRELDTGHLNWASEIALVVAVREVRGKPRDDCEQVQGAVINNVVHNRALLGPKVVVEDDPRHRHKPQALQA